MTAWTTAVTCEEAGRVLKDAAGQIDASRVDKHTKAPHGLTILVTPLSAGSIPLAHHCGLQSNHPSGR